MCLPGDTFLLLPLCIQSDSRLVTLEGKVSLLKGDQKESLEQFQQQIQDYISAKVDLLSQKPNHFGCSGRGQNAATPSGRCTSKTRSGTPSPGANFKPPPSPLLCSMSNSSGVGRQPPKDTHVPSRGNSSGNHPGEEVKETSFSCMGGRAGCQQTRWVTEGREVFNMIDSPSANPPAHSASQPLGRKAAATRKKKQALSSSQPGRKRRTRASTREQASKCKAPRYSPLVHLMDHPRRALPQQVTSCQRGVQEEESICSKLSPVNALDDSLYSSVSQMGTPDTSHTTCTSSGVVPSCDSSWSGMAFTSWRVSARCTCVCVYL